MPLFEIQGPDGKTYELDAPDQNAAVTAFGMMGAQPRAEEQAPDLDPNTGMPAGMVLDPNTGQVIDTNARADALRKEGGFMQGASDMAGQFVSGAPVVGEFLDEAAGLVGGDMGLENARAKLRSYQEANPGTATALKIAGGITGTLPMVASGLSLGANAATAGQGLGRIAMGSAADGAIMGAAAGAGAGDGAQDRVTQAITGGVTGGVIGGATPLATAGLSTIAKPLVAPIMSRLRPDAYANRALGEGLERSGSSVDDVTAALLAARGDGQDMFNVADAMGNAGQRMLSTVARTPNNERQMVVEALQARQMGQGERLSNALAEGFAAPDTAQQRIASLISKRTADANTNYGAARAGSEAIDPSAAIQSADDFLRPGAMGIMRNETGIADDSIESAVRRARGYLTDGTSVLTDFNAGLRSKQELDAMIEGAKPAVQRQLIPIRNALDDALSNASPDYANARDVFRQQSQTIDAVDQGTAAASGRVRADDSIPAFNGMGLEQQAAFRAGYADPHIARVEAASVSPTTNKARMLMTGKTEQEFPAFAAPGKGEQMGDRIGREQRMFETANAALGGSKTADNLADAAEMARFDPTVMTALFSGRPVQAVVAAVTRALGEAKGMPPTVVERMARVLMETRPDVARKMLQKGADKTQANRGVQAVTNALLTTLGSTAAGR